MEQSNDGRMAFCHESKYKVGAVTFEVAAFFNESGEDVRDKLLRLLKADVHHPQSADSIAGSQVGTVK